MLVRKRKSDDFKKIFFHLKSKKKISKIKKLMNFDVVVFRGTLRL